MGYDLHEKGVPTIDDATCTGCGQCVEICGDRVLALKNGKARAGDGVFILGYPAVTFRRGVRRRLASVAFA